jgi:very-short-patch-repair endonuclease
MVDWRAMNHDAPLLNLASRQHGAVAVRQASALGISRAALRHRIDKGQWERISQRVLRLAGSPASQEQRLMVAVLHHAPAAFLARSTALACWRLPGFQKEPIELLSSRRRRITDDGLTTVHSSRDLLLAHVTEVDGIPITTPARALFDIAATEHPKRVERAIDNALARRLVTNALLHRTLRELADRGRHGITLMRELLDARPPSYRPPESNTEARLNDLLERAGQRRLSPQHDVGDDEAWIGRIDLRDEEAPLLVEVQSDLFHGSLLDRQRDQERIGALRAAGFVVLEIWESAVWHRPDEVVAAVVGPRRHLMARAA